MRVYVGLWAEWVLTEFLSQVLECVTDMSVAGCRIWGGGGGGGLDVSCWPEWVAQLGRVGRDRVPQSGNKCWGAIRRVFGKGCCQ